MLTSESVYKFKIYEYRYSYFQDPQNYLKHKPLYRRPNPPDAEDTCVPVWIVLRWHNGSTCCTAESGCTAPSPCREHLPTAPWQLPFVPVVPELHGFLRPWECSRELPKVLNVIAMPSELWGRSGGSSTLCLRGNTFIFI